MRRHKHAYVKEEPLIERPSRSVALRERLQSPWLVIGQYVFNILIVLLIAYLAGNQAQFSDYLNGRGDYRDREAARAKELAEERLEQSRETLCRLIAALEADIGGELERISREANCKEGPQEPASFDDSRGSLDNETSQDGPIARGPDIFTSTPTPGDQATTGNPGEAAPGRESQPPSVPAPTTPPPSPPSGGGEEPPPPPGGGPDDGGGGSIADDLIDDLCIVLGCG